MPCVGFLLPGRIWATGLGVCEMSHFFPIPVEENSTDPRGLQSQPFSFQKTFSDSGQRERRSEGLPLLPSHGFLIFHFYY